MFRNSLIISSIFVVSRIVMMLAQAVNARLFGATQELDTFLTAAAIPTVLVTAIYSTLGDVYLSQIAHRSKDFDEKEYFRKTFWQLSIFSLGIVFLLFVLTEPIVRLFYGNSGLSNIIETANKMSWLFVSLPLAIVAALGGAYYQRQYHFNRFPLMQLLTSILSLILVILFYKILGIWILVVTFDLNFLIHLLGVARPLNLRSLRYIFTDWNETWVMLKSWIPVLSANLVLTSNAIIIQIVALQLDKGYPTYFNIIFKMFSMAVGVAVIGVQMVFLTHATEAVQKKQNTMAQIYLNRARLWAIALSAGTVLTVWIFGPSIVDLIYVGGKFTQSDANTIRQIFPYFVAPAFGWGIITTFAQKLILYKKYKFVIYSALFSTFLGVATIYLFAPVLGLLLAMSLGMTLISVFFATACYFKI